MKKYVYTFLALLSCSSVYGQNQFDQIIIGERNSIPNFAHAWVEGNGYANILINNSSESANRRLWAITVANDEFRILTEADDFSAVKDAFFIKRAAGIGIDYVSFPEGKLGVGTYNPSSKFEIKSSGTLGGTWNISNAFLRIHDGNASMIFDNDEIYSETNFHLGISDNGYFKFRTVSGTGYNDLMYLGNNGRVGIGTTDPEYKLSVAGTIQAQEIRVENVPQSDFVFEPDYNLLPIREVETFIKKNKHLPKIPSAEQFREKGVGVGEMNDMLLRKIEELTLYIIGQNKIQEKLIERITELEKIEE